MPELGEIIYGRELGYTNTTRSKKYVWHACEDCGKQRWVAVCKGKPSSSLCKRCCLLGDRSSLWKGGCKTREYRRQHYLLIRERTRQRYFELKINILTHYGNNKCACVRCGESRLACLSIDHIKGGGKRHLQKELKIGGGQGFYQWLKANNYPEGFQTLCMNCQFVKRAERNEYPNSPTLGK